MAMLTTYKPPEEDKETGGRLKLPFSPSVFLQNFALPFRWSRAKAKLEGPPPIEPPASRELIELASFGVVEVDPGGRGLGHRFLPSRLRSPTWCDRCGDFVWGLRECVQCQLCRYTAHRVCQDLVTLDCKGTTDTQLADTLSDIWEDAQETLTDTKEEAGAPYSSSLLSHQLLSREELAARIEHYNSLYPNLQITVDEEGGSYHGLIRVHLHLTRPINVISGTRPPSIYDIMSEDTEGHRTLTSFYLPLDTVKAINVTSEFTCREVITALLRKFKVADHPHKFALYERHQDPTSGKSRLRPLPDLERPLTLALLWAGEDKQLVLQENLAGEIMWEGFALAELTSFLRILNQEEEENIRLVRAKYRLLQDRLQDAIALRS